MSSVPCQFLQAQWSLLVLYLSRICCGFRPKLRSLDNKWRLDAEPNISADKHTANAETEYNSPNHFPPSEQQTKHATQQFISSININAVCDLASRYTGGKQCKIVKKDHDYCGSFNVCFFVHFDAENKTYVLRIPIIPVVRHPWKKILSETATMRYVERNTSIPIPRIIAHGKDDMLVEGHSTPFIIMDLASGQSLHTELFLSATKAKREQLYTDLIDILAQLRDLQFTTGGSLMPNQNDEHNPIVGPFLSMTANEFERSSGMELKPEIFTSAEGFIDYHQHILAETYRLPVEYLTDRDAKHEIFALHSLSNEVHKCMDFTSRNDPFVLTHPDLRFGNILVDDNFHILSIIDWEFAGTIPLPLFAPPPWITDHDPDTLRVMRKLSGYPFRGDLLTEFREVLQRGSDISERWAMLRRDWGFQHSNRQDKELLQSRWPVVQILRHPSSLMNVYYSSTFYQLFGPKANRDVEINNFFELPGNKLLAEQISLQVGISECYSRHLESKALSVDDQHRL